MKTEMNIAEAKAKLSSLVQKALDGEEVILARDGKPVARIVSLAAEGKRKRRFGALKREYGWTGPPTPYEVFEPEPEDAIDGPIFPDDPDSP
jgi:prevent-host-death family protein